LGEGESSKRVPARYQPGIWMPPLMVMGLSLLLALCISNRAESRTSRAESRAEQRGWARTEQNNNKKSGKTCAVGSMKRVGWPSSASFSYIHTATSAQPAAAPARPQAHASGDCCCRHMQLFQKKGMAARDTPVSPSPCMKMTEPLGFLSARGWMKMVPFLSSQDTLGGPAASAVNHRLAGLSSPPRQHQPCGLAGEEHICLRRHPKPRDKAGLPSKRLHKPRGASMWSVEFFTQPKFSLSSKYVQSGIKIRFSSHSPEN